MDFPQLAFLNARVFSGNGQRLTLPQRGLLFADLGLAEHSRNLTTTNNEGRLFLTFYDNIMNHELEQTSVSCWTIFIIKKQKIKRKIKVCANLDFENFNDERRGEMDLLEHEGSISQMLYDQLLCKQTPKVQRDTDDLTVFFFCFQDLHA